MRTEFLCITVLRVASGPRVKLASCKSALTSPPVVYSSEKEIYTKLCVFDQYVRQMGPTYVKLCDFT